MRNFGLVLLSAVVVSVMAAGAQADFGVRTGDKVLIDTAPGAFDSNVGIRGGPFSATDQKVGGQTFLTFCLETDEFVSDDAVYHVSVDEAAIDGGAGGPSPDPLDARTRALFGAFSGPNWSTVFSTATGIAWANTGGQKLQVQRAIWSIEEEITLGVSDTIAANLVTWATGKDDDRVKVMNLYANADFTGLKQSLLTIVPEPASLLAWAGIAGVFGGGFYLRRRRR